MPICYSVCFHEVYAFLHRGRRPPAFTSLLFLPPFRIRNIYIHPSSPTLPARAHVCCRRFSARNIFERLRNERANISTIHSGMLFHLFRRVQLSMRFRITYVNIFTSISGLQFSFYFINVYLYKCICICINISFLFLSYNFGKRRNIEGEIIRMGDGDCGGGALAHLYSCALHGIKMTRAIS